MVDNQVDNQSPKVDNLEHLVDNQREARESGEFRKITREQVDNQNGEVDNQNPQVDNQKNPSEMPSESPLEAELRNRIIDKDKEIQRLVGQLSAKDEQIREKDQQIRSLQESLQAAQLIQAKQMQVQIPEHTETAAAQGSGFLAKLKAWWNSTAPQA